MKCGLEKDKVWRGSFLTVAILILCMGVVFAGFGLETVSAAEKTEAELTAIHGEVFVKKNGGQQEFKAFKGMKLMQGDWLRTGMDGLAQITYSDGTEMTVDANSQITIQQLSEENKAKKTSVRLMAGSVWNKVKSLLNVGDKYEVETPTAVMGVRGTLFKVSINNQDGSTTGDIIDGAVNARQNTERSESGIEQLITAGLGLSLGATPGDPPQAQEIDQERFVAETQPRLLSQVISDIISRTEELLAEAERASTAYQQTKEPSQIRNAVLLAYKSDALASFAQQFARTVESSPKAAEVEQVLRENNQSLDQIKSVIEETKQQSKQTKNEVQQAATEAGIDPDELESFIEEGMRQVGAPVQDTAQPPSPPTPPEDSGDSGQGDPGDQGTGSPGQTPAPTLDAGTHYVGPRFGGAVGATALILLPSKYPGTDHYEYIISNTTIPIPSVGAFFEGETYVSGGNIFVSPGKHIGLAAVTADRRVVAFADIIVQEHHVVRDKRISTTRYEQTSFGPFYVPDDTVFVRVCDSSLNNPDVVDTVTVTVISTNEGRDPETIVIELTEIDALTHEPSENTGVFQGSVILANDSNQAFREIKGDIGARINFEFDAQGVWENPTYTGVWVLESLDTPELDIDYTEEQGTVVVTNATLPEPLKFYKQGLEYKIADQQIETPQLYSKYDGIPYQEGQEIPDVKGKYIGLAAVNSEGYVVGFTCIEVTDSADPQLTVEREGDKYGQFFLPGDTVNVTLTGVSSGSGSVSVWIYPEDEEGIELSLTETAPNFGIFRGSFTFDEIEATVGDIVYIFYDYNEYDYLMSTLMLVENFETPKLDLYFVEEEFNDSIRLEGWYSPHSADFYYGVDYLQYKRSITPMPVPALGSVFGGIEFGLIDGEYTQALEIPLSLEEKYIGVAAVDEQGRVLAYTTIDNLITTINTQGYGPFYTFNDQVLVRLYASGLDVSAGNDSAAVKVLSEITLSEIEIELQETGGNTGIFEGYVTLGRSSNEELQIIETDFEDKVSFIYESYERSTVVGVVNHHKTPKLRLDIEEYEGEYVLYRAELPYKNYVLTYNLLGDHIKGLRYTVTSEPLASPKLWSKFDGQDPIDIFGYYAEFEVYEKELSYNSYYGELFKLTIPPGHYLNLAAVDGADRVIAFTTWSDEPKVFEVVYEPSHDNPENPSIIRLSFDSALTGAPSPTEFQLFLNNKLEENAIVNVSVAENEVVLELNSSLSSKIIKGDKVILHYSRGTERIRDDQNRILGSFVTIVDTTSQLAGPKFDKTSCYVQPYDSDGLYLWLDSEIPYNEELAATPPRVYLNYGLEQPLKEIEIAGFEWDIVEDKVYNLYIEFKDQQYFDVGDIITVFFENDVVSDEDGTLRSVDVISKYGY